MKRSRQRSNSRFGSSPRGRTLGQDGLTIVELLTAVVIMSILTTMVLVTSASVSKSSRNKQAIVDILDLQTRIDDYAMFNDALPSTLADIGKGGMLDPWGRAYVYAPFNTTPPGKRRKDRFLVPLNTTYDLYSIGADGLTTPSLNGGRARDDIVRANDGGYVGLGAAY